MKFLEQLLIYLEKYMNYYTSVFARLMEFMFLFESSIISYNAGLFKTIQSKNAIKISNVNTRIYIKKLFWIINCFIKIMQSNF